MASLGIYSAPARAMPVDALVAIGEHFLDGAVIGRIALLVPLLAAGWGVQRILGDAGLLARLVGGGFAVWNPFVVERLALGQWTVVWAYAAVPWLLLATVRIANARSATAVRHLLLPAAFASVTATGGVLTLVVVGCVFFATRPGWRPVLSGLIMVVCLQTPWALATVLGSSRLVIDPASSVAFAARPEWGGIIPTLLTGGGIWNADITPASRGTFLVLIGAVIIVGAAFLARRRARIVLGEAAHGWLMAAGVGCALALASCVPGVSVVVHHLIAVVPGGGLLRDGQKWIAPSVAYAAVLVGLAVEDVQERARERSLAPWRLMGIAAGAVLLPVLLLPDAVRVVWPTLTPVSYPHGYTVVDELVKGGDVVSLPFQPYRAFSWAGERPALDPAPRLLSAHVIVDDRLSVGNRLLGGEDPRADRIGTALSSSDLPAALAEAGVEWVLVERDTPGVVPDVSALRMVYSDAAVALYRVRNPVSVRPSHTKLVAEAAATLVWAAAASLALLSATWPLLMTTWTYVRRLCRNRDQDDRLLQG
ncbi:hypothetical protein [Streptomyces chartreusis]|uniref:hypothetical protein n=1 Tax=Streptomyces chartreusis TaxID=1969 RepID=UPI003685BECB